MNDNTVAEDILYPIETLLTVHGQIEQIDGEGDREEENDPRYPMGNGD
jgi:hypothetical protein